MKIAILADPLDNQYAGIHVFCKEFISALLKIDKYNEYFIVRSKATNDFPEATELVFPINDKIPLHNRIRQFSSIPKKLKKLKIDVAFELAHFGPFGLGNGIKKITFIHDVTPILFPQFHSPMSQFTHKLLLPGILKRADLILCNSKATENDLAKLYPFACPKTKVTHLGCNQIFKPNLNRVILEKYDLKSPYFLFVGTLEPRKNVDTLLQAWIAYKENGGKEKLVLVGKKGWGVDKLISSLKTNAFAEDIIQLGYLPENELPVFYSHAAAFIYPSLYEGFGLPVLEAMACGCPVVISNNSALPEVGGDAAIYFDAKNAEMLTKALSEVSKLDSKQAKANSISQAEKFSWEKTATSFLQAISDLPK